MNHRLIVVAGLAAMLLTSSAGTAEPPKEISGEKLDKPGQFTAGEVQVTPLPEKGKVLHLVNPDNKARTFQLVEIKDPGITELYYAVRGRLKYQDVLGTGYLEMWSYFPDGSHYFTRTLSNSGVMKSISGTSDWRPFALPFSITSGSAERPNRLVINLVLEGSGSVSFTVLDYEQYTHPPEERRKPGAWWNERTAGILGGILGTLFGCFGGTIGILAGRGKARRFVMTALIVMPCMGLVFLIVGAVALAIGQPYEVWYPLLLSGIILTVVCGGARSTIRRRYNEMELARMSAVDLGPTS